MQKKMQNRMLFYLLTLMFLTSMTACIKNPMVTEVNNFNILGFKNKILQVELDVLVNNPNKFVINLESIESFIAIEGIEVGQSKNLTPTPLLGKQITPIHVNIDAQVDKLAKSLPKLMGQDSTLVEINSKIRLKGKLGSFTLPNKSKQYIDFKEQIKQLIFNGFSSSSSFQIKNVNFSNTDSIQVDVLFQNPFPFDYELVGGKLDFFLNSGKTSLGNWEITETKMVKASSQVIVPIYIQLNYKELLGTLPSLLFGTKPMLVTKGNGLVVVEGETIDIPIQEKIALSLSSILQN